MAKRGRPPTISPAVRLAAERSFSKGIPIPLIAEALGISYSSVYKWVYVTPPPSEAEVLKAEEVKLLGKLAELLERLNENRAKQQSLASNSKVEQAQTEA